jgi:hypothetical protein
MIYHTQGKLDSQYTSEMVREIMQDKNIYILSISIP